MVAPPEQVGEIGDYYTQAHTYFWKSSWISADWKTATPDTPEMIDSFQKMADLFLKVQGAPKPGELSGANVDNFIAGKVAMFAQAPGGFLSQLVEGAKNGAPFALAALPTMKLAQQLHLDVIKEGYNVTAGMDAINMQPQTADIKSTILNPMETEIFSGKHSVEDALRSVKAPLQNLIQPVEG